jgi:hypothetical protein
MLQCADVESVRSRVNAPLGAPRVGREEVLRELDARVAPNKRLHPTAE